MCTYTHHVCFHDWQIEVLEESKIMIPDCKRRIKAAYNDLQNLVVSDFCHIKSIQFSYAKMVKSWPISTKSIIRIIV